MACIQPRAPLPRHSRVGGNRAPLPRHSRVGGNRAPLSVIPAQVELTRYSGDATGPNGTSISVGASSAAAVLRSAASSAAGLSTRRPRAP